MEKQNTPFIESQYYPVIFMLLSTFIIVGLLAVFYHATEKRIEDYRIHSYHNLIVGLFADSIASNVKVKAAELTDPANSEKAFQLYFHQLDKPFLYYQVIVGNQLLGYCFDITGSGLWGTMHGLIGTTPDLQTIVNFNVYQQEETPGLGARVSEDWFKRQFVGKKIIQNKQAIGLVLVPEGAPSAGSNEIRQITGATITSTSVSKMLKAEMNRIYAAMQLSSSQNNTLDRMQK